MSVGIDSNILIYAGIVPCKPGPRSNEYQDLGFRARLLMRQLADPKVTILLPTVAMAELLIPVPNHHRGPLIAALQKKFVCPSLDLPAAAIAADLWSRHKDLPSDLQYSERRVLTADALIVASVFSAGGTDFYSHDSRCRALAGMLMTAHDLPTRGDDLFIDGEIREQMSSETDLGQNRQ